MTAVDNIAEVRLAVEGGEWEHALELLAAAGRAGECPEGLELRARAAYGKGDFEGSVAAWEDLHALLVADGEAAGAAMAAAMIAMFLMMDTGLMAPVRGWLRRAERLLDGDVEAPANAIIAVTRAYERFLCGDMAAAGTNASLAVELGTRLGVQQAVVIGRVCLARVTIFNGQVSEGLGLLDEIAIDLMSGDVDPLTTGMMYCELICVAQGMALQDRAAEWTDVMDRFRRDGAIGSIGGRCRVHRAELLRISGPCDLAEAEALAACEELRPWMRREFGWPLVELGNIRLRRGDLAGADEAFMAAHERAWSPFPGLALLRLEQGDIRSASAMIADAIAHPMDIPWKERPPFGALRLAPLLDAQAEIAAAAGDVETVRHAARQLDSIASSYPSRSLQAGALLASARAALISGELDQAIVCSTAATAAWADIGAPFEAAAARMVLGEARHRSGDVEGAQMEWNAAGAAFTSFGAVRWAGRATRIASDSLDIPTSPQPGEGTIAIFRCEGDTRSIGYEGLTVLMRDLKGFRYIERLLGDPGREFHVLDLIAAERAPTSRRLETSGDHEAGHAGVDEGLPILDDQARAAYRRRLAEVDDDIQEATEMNDIGRVELGQRDRDYLLAELKRAVGLGGRPRSVGGASERARTSVTRSLRYAQKRLSEHHPMLADHFGHSVHTGTFCVYAPDSRIPIVWNL